MSYKLCLARAFLKLGRYVDKCFKGIDFCCNLLEIISPICMFVVGIISLPLAIGLYVAGYRSGNDNYTSTGEIFFGLGGIFYGSILIVLWCYGCNSILSKCHRNAVRIVQEQRPGEVVEEPSSNSVQIEETSIPVSPDVTLVSSLVGNDKHSDHTNDSRNSSDGTSNSSSTIRVGNRDSTH